MAKAKYYFFCIIVDVILAFLAFLVTKIVSIESRKSESLVLAVAMT